MMIASHSKHLRYDSVLDIALCYLCVLLPACPLALLFALFRTKPSPFCILDEVDAPLDDVNTMRFVGLLKTMSDETQFIVITHNKLTMAAASALYGVTMAERGVSKVVSVELDDIHPNEKAVTA